MAGRKRNPDSENGEPLIIGPLAAGPAPELSNSESEDYGAHFVQAAEDLVQRLRQRDEKLSMVVKITERINYGVMLEEVLEFVYRELQQMIPYNRIGFSLIDEKRGAVVARWAHSDREMLLRGGYEAPLEGSTLQKILATGRPRIINDLEAYLHRKPHSDSTGLIVAEGMRSSLTCPLIVQGKPVGFMFFSSIHKSAYSKVHIGFFRQIAGQLSVIVEKAHLYSELAEQKAVIEEQNRAMTQELEMARRVQRALVPLDAPDLPGLDIAFEYEPAIQIGGDVLDIIRLGDDRLFLFVGDATGHGVPAALIMSVVKTALQSAVQADPRPATVLSRVNRFIAELFNEHFVTAVCCLVDAAAEQVEVASAGHGVPLWFRKDLNDVVEQGDADLPLGIDGSVEYESFQIDLGPGDALVFYTDGIVEAFDHDKNQYGQERLRNEVLRRGSANASELLAAIKDDLKAHCSGRAMSDDLTLLVVKPVDRSSNELA